MHSTRPLTKLKLHSYHKRSAKMYDFNYVPSYQPQMYEFSCSALNLRSWSLISGSEYQYWFSDAGYLSLSSLLHLPSHLTNQSFVASLSSPEATGAVGLGCETVKEWSSDVVPTETPRTLLSSPERSTDKVHNLTWKTIHSAYQQLQIVDYNKIIQGNSPEATGAVGLGCETVKEWSSDVVPTETPRTLLSSPERVYF
ncbi:hypothetical protein Lal_00034769 [Lupinus albus]|nr:hypothetical protein Lal_00034769 [Lupinus albus]